MFRHVSRASIALAGIVLSVAAGGGCRRNEPPPFMLDIGPAGPAVFPPPDEGWTERAPAAISKKHSADEPVHLSSPALDDKKHFETEGQVIRLYFSDALVPTNPDKSAKLPALTITPPVAGKTVWEYGSEVSFHADKPFDPEKTYTIELPALETPSGKKVPAFKATFRAQPRIEIAGKTVNYFPQKGHARVVAVLPQDKDRIGASQEVAVIFDQPVDMSLAAQLVTVTNASDKRVWPAMRHPDADAFDGVKVDRRFVVLVKPPTQKAGDTFTITAKSQVASDDKEKPATLTIAEPPKVESIVCGYGRADCTVDGSTIHGTTSSNVEIRTNNPLLIGYSNAKKYVSVSPPAKNLYVSGWGSGVHISGSFAPSTRYSIRIEGVRDTYGGWLPPQTFTLVTKALPASITIGDRAILLDDATAKAFPVTTRNVARAEIAFWPLPKGDIKAFAKALDDVRVHSLPATDPIVVPFTPPATRDEFVDTPLDLRAKLEVGRSYIAEARISSRAGDAPEPSYPSGSDAAKRSAALVTIAGGSALGAHVHRAADTAAVQVFRLGSGEPVAKAKVTIGDTTVESDAAGLALLPVKASENELVARVANEDADVMVPFGGSFSTKAQSLFPELGAKEGEARALEAVGMLVTDRGIYRPGSKMFVKAIVRKIEAGAIKPIGSVPVRLRVIDPMNKDVTDENLTTNAKGTLDRTVSFENGSHTGRYRVLLENAEHRILAEETIRVAEFEAPKFKVDVEREDAPADKIKAKVVAKYLFGAPMSGAHVSWVLKKTRIPVKGGAFEGAGMRFDHERSYWYWDEDDDDVRSSKEELRPLTGEATIGADGSLPLDIAVGQLAKGPTEITLEADVSDSSNRHVAGALHFVKDPFGRHAGIRLKTTFGDPKEPLHVDLGVVDRDGTPIAGAKVSARLEKTTWTRSAQKAESGAIVERWHEAKTTVAECEVTSGATMTGCDLKVPSSGSYRVTARIDGREGGSVSYYAYGGSSERGATPSAGKKVPLVMDKQRYRAGETAHVLVQSPFASAIALLTVEQGGIVRHESRRITGAAATFDIPVTAANAPWAHAAITLLPIAQTEADFRVGVVRIPVGNEDTKLDVKVASAKKAYEIRDEAEITIEVKRNGQPVANADVSLAVVDEGVLRLTAHHAKDPSVVLRPGMPLAFDASDSRGWLVTRRERAHVAGGGDSEGEESLDTRRKFVETAAWLPSLTTDANGKIVTKVKLPDNLTELRMTAVAVDGGGAGGTAESSFVVTKALLLEPVMPRFAIRGDKLEAAAMVHNNTDAPVAAKVTVAGQVREVTIPAKGRQRVGVPMDADKAGTRKMLFALEANGRSLDKVEIPFRVEEPGIEEHPQASGAFGEKHEMTLAIPEDAIFEEGAFLSIKTGSALYPELGQRLTYLLDYPHGCVEQTTSSTIPLIAARTLLPWTGVTKMEDAEIKRRIEAGVNRLASMQTTSGGLAYWPGGGEPNTYGSAYALRALVRAKAMGIEKKGLVEGVSRYLAERVVHEQSRSLRVAIADVLAESKLLPESAADALWDGRDELDAFGLASAAIALSALPKQEDRVKDLLDRLEKSFNEEGNPTGKHDEHDYYYWGSNDRDRAQATIALSKLRPKSMLLPVLASRLSRKIDSYTTQSTAWSLLALSDYVGHRAPSGTVDVAVKLEGRILDTYEHLGGDNKEVRIPLKDLAGKKVKLLLTGDYKTPSAFALETHYRRPLAAQGSRVARRAVNGVSIHRVFTDPKGNPIDLANVKAGSLVRIALQIQLPKLDSYRLSYVAITDRLPGGFEPVDTDLATTANVPDLGAEHPFHEGLTGYGGSASHVDVRDDRVQLYFDRVHVGGSGRTVHATYVARATTPGKFVIPPARGELMYENDSEGWSDAGVVEIK